MTSDIIRQRAEDLLGSLPQDVVVVAAAKTRTPEEVEAAVDGGISVLGYNYFQEAERMYQAIGEKVAWHMIGHLQRNKAKKAVALFDMIETVDSVRLAAAIDRQCEEIGKTMPILIEVNSGREANKSGVFPEDVEALVLKLKKLQNIRLQGLMTMGPYLENPIAMRPYFRETRTLFEHLVKQGLDNVAMKYLSMGMSSSFEIAIEEGANMVRIGTKLFGEREY